jgi:hypothetical protein
MGLRAPYGTHSSHCPSPRSFGLRYCRTSRALGHLRLRPYPRCAFHLSPTCEVLPQVCRVYTDSAPMPPVFPISPYANVYVLLSAVLLARGSPFSHDFLWLGRLYTRTLSMARRWTSWAVIGMSAKRRLAFSSIIRILGFSRYSTLT